MQGPLVLSATHETKSALVLAELAKQCKFGEWRNTPFGAESSGTITLGRKSLDVCLRIGSHDGVYVEEEEGTGHTFTRENGIPLIKVGKKLPETDAACVAELLGQKLAIFCGKRQPLM